MVGIVVVSHSADLAHAAVDLALQMVPGSAPRIEVAAGTSDNRLGTDASRVAEAIVTADDGDGVAVIMDLGSAVLSAEMALELLPEPHETRLVPAAFAEGIFAAVIAAAAGADLDVVARDATEALQAKATQLDQDVPQVNVAPPPITRPAIVAEATVVNRAGIHARPAALIVAALASLEAQVMISTERSAAVAARSPTAVMSLGARPGDVLRIEADGAGAAAAVDRILALVCDGSPKPSKVRTGPDGSTAPACIPSESAQGASSAPPTECPILLSSLIQVFEFPTRNGQSRQPG
jgi:phosphotransferase system enzyme I (PtsI)